MDVGAELALRLARLVQLRTFAPDGFDAWFLVPSFRKVSWAEARDLLSAVPKPLIVSPLPDPGFLGIWPLSTVPETDVAGSRHHVANQVAYFRAKLTALGYTTEDHVSFADGGEPLTLSVPEFLSWCAEYAVFAGTTVERRQETGVAWLVVVRPRPRASEQETPQTRRPASKRRLVQSAAHGHSVEAATAHPNVMRIASNSNTTTPRLKADFNGLFGDVLCLSHSDSCEDENGVVVSLHTGMIATAYEEDSDETGQRDDLVASGVIERSPSWLQCQGSRWVLRIDANGVRHATAVQMTAPFVAAAPRPHDRNVRNAT